LSSAFCRAGWLFQINVAGDTLANMTLFVVIAILALLALLGAAILIPYLCAMVTGRALAWVFQVESGQSAREADELLSPEDLAEIDALLASSKQMARDAQRRADAWPAAR